MGHVTALGASPDEALARAREAAAHIGWAARRLADEPATASPRMTDRRGVVGGSRSDFPVLEKAVEVLEGARRARGAAGRFCAPNAGPPVPLRRIARRAGASG